MGPMVSEKVIVLIYLWESNISDKSWKVNLDLLFIAIASLNRSSEYNGFVFNSFQTMNFSNNFPFKFTRCQIWPWG